MAEKIILCQKSNMTKLIELNPEWVLSELPQCHLADGNGNVSIFTDTSSDASWIKLALKTLNIPYKESEYIDGDPLLYDVEFLVEDLREDCPALYIKMKEMDAKNKIYKHTNLN